MASTRTRLTVSYAVVLIATMVAFAVALLFARRAGADQELAADAGALGNEVLSVLGRARDEGRNPTFVDTSSFRVPMVRATQELGELLDPMPGYFMVLGKQGQILYYSTLVRLLTPDDRQLLVETALRLTPGSYWEIVPLEGETERDISVLMVARTDSVTGPNISLVVAGLPTNTAELAARLLLGTMLVLTPLIVLISLGLAYFIAGRAFRPVDRLINEVEAITDGRSLHRRLPSEQGNDELARLSATLNAMLARLERSFAALRRFTADASHELKTPLTVMRADVERAMHPGTYQTDRLVALEEALQEVARMADLVDSLLTLARADEGRFDIHRAPVTLEPLIREVFETAVILGTEAGLAMELPLLEDGVVLGDRKRLRQLFLNLVINAIKYTPRGGRVEISAGRRAHDEIAFAVRDTGVGISANDLPHIFERFWRADRVRSRSSERSGFGLGLAISQWIVQAHGGSLSVQSRLGRGTVFTVVLPLVTPDQISAAADADPEMTARTQADSNRDFTVF